MFCRNCQTIIPDDSFFCENCGAPTGLSPEQLDDSNLIPEEAVEFEVVEEEASVQTTSVPVDPVWWEPPEDEDEPIDVEITGIFPEEEQETDGFAGEKESDAAEDFDDMSREVSSDAEELTETDETESSVHADAPYSWEAQYEQEEAEASEKTDERQPDGADAEGQWIWEEPEPEQTAEPAEGEDREALEERSGSHDAEDREERSGRHDREDREEQAERSGSHDAEDRSEGAEDDENEETESLEDRLSDLKEKALSAAGQAKPYAEKAKAWLGGLGNNVHTGTGKAWMSAKEQFLQRKGDYEERREQKQKEKETKEIEQERRERERQRELARQQEEERRAAAKVIQQPGFWYGSSMPKRTESASAEADDKEDVLRSFAESEESLETVSSAGYGADVNTEASEESGAEPDAAPADPLPADEIEDKLADTTRFDWSRGDLEAAVAAAEAAKRAAEESNDEAEDPEAEENGRPEGRSDEADSSDRSDLSAEGTEESHATGEIPAIIAKEDVPEDEPAIYRIKDFGPTEYGGRGSAVNRDTVKIIFIILAIIIAIGAIFAVVTYQNHMQQLAEEAYQESLVQAGELASDGKYDQAEKEYLILIKERPEDTAPYLGLAEMYVEQQRYVDAKALIKRGTEATGDEEAFQPTKKKLAILTSRKWKNAYIKVLKENEDGIRRYEEDVTAPVAICDVNGDLKPELFFFTKEYYGYGKLHIYTTVNNKAKEVSYECWNRATQYSDAFYDVSSTDFSYAVFNGKKQGRFFIYAHVEAQGRSWDTINQYRLKKKGKCIRTQVLEGSTDTDYDDGTVDNAMYMKNDEGITYDKYNLSFRRKLNNVEDVILYNGSEGDQSVWAKVKPNNVMCMSYDALMTDLKAK